MKAPTSFDNIAIGAYRNSKDNIGIHTTLDTLRVSRLNTLYDTHPREYPLHVIIKEIQRGSATLENLSEHTPYRTLAQVTQRARELRYQHGNKEAYDLLKKEMPQIIPAAVFVRTIGNTRVFTSGVFRVGRGCGYRSRPCHR